MKAIEIIISVYKDRKIDQSQNIFCIAYPETERTPQQQVDYIKELSIDKSCLERDKLTVVTVSPYIAEAIITYFKFIIDEEIILCDGKSIVTSEEFFGHFANPMKEMTIYSLKL